MDPLCHISPEQRYGVDAESLHSHGDENHHDRSDSLIQRELLTTCIVELGSGEALCGEHERGTTDRKRQELGKLERRSTAVSTPI